MVKGLGVLTMLDWSIAAAMAKVTRTDGWNNPAGKVTVASMLRYYVHAMVGLERFYDMTS